MVKEELSTGAVARACGVSPDTIRYYERRGAIASRHGANGYRYFSAETVERVRMIRRALAIGFTTEEIARFLREREQGRAPCRSVRAAAGEKLGKLDRQIEELTELRQQLAAIVADWDDRLARTSGGEPARLLETLPERTSS